MTAVDSRFLLGMMRKACLDEKLPSSMVEKYGRIAPRIGVCCQISWDGIDKVDSLIFTYRNGEWDCTDTQFAFENNDDGYLLLISEGRHAHFDYSHPYYGLKSPTLDSITHYIKNAIAEKNYYQSHSSSEDEHKIEIEVHYDIFTTSTILQNLRQCSHIHTLLENGEHAEAVEYESLMRKSIQQRLTKVMNSLKPWSELEFRNNESGEFADVQPSCSLRSDDEMVRMRAELEGVAYSDMKMQSELSIAHIFGFTNKIVLLGVEGIQPSILESAHTAITWTEEWIGKL